MQATPACESEHGGTKLTQPWPLGCWALCRESVSSDMESYFSWKCSRPGWIGPWYSGRCPRPWQWGWNEMNFKIPSNLNQSVTSFCSLWAEGSLGNPSLALPELRALRECCVSCMSKKQSFHGVLEAVNQQLLSDVSPHIRLEHWKKSCMTCSGSALGLGIAVLWLRRGRKARRAALMSGFTPALPGTSLGGSLEAPHWMKHPP